MSNKWKFVQHPIRQPLTAQEVNYWKLNLSRLLKVGAEFEFNLPEKTTGSCKGRSFTCPCVNYGSEEVDCWTKCYNEKKCASTPNMSKCANKIDACKEGDCETCENFAFKCIGITCSSMIPACFSCKDFKLDCTSCSFRFDPSKNPDAIREACKHEFNPSGSYGVVAKSGVHNIVTDGSLLGKKGMEIITTGRRVDFWEFYKMSKSIIDKSVSRGAYINERCSIHMHALASYYGKVPGMGGSSNKISELEKSVPEIVVANLHQLIRKYQNAITWMTTGLDDPKKLTRWEKFRVSVLGISAISNNMREVKEMVMSEAGGNKYGWINYKMCEHDENGDLKRLHVEVRVMDGLLSPSAVSAMACLYYSLFIKAVELSRYGVVEVGDAKWLDQALTIKKALMNNNSDWDTGNKEGRFSDTTNLPKYTNILVSESFELISQLKHILSTVGPAYEILEKLAESPCSIRRCEGRSWEEIEEELAVKLTEEGVFEYQIKKIIDTREVSGVANIQAWMDKTAQILKESEELELDEESVEELSNRVLMHFEEKQSNGEMIWADKIGSVISI